jgi:excisionase family DNA binding protein
MATATTTERPATQWLTPELAAQCARVATHTIYREIDRGRLKAFRIADGRLLRIRAQDFDAWMTREGGR